MTAGTRTYLDYNATAPMLPAACAAFVEGMNAANPSSVHREGRSARAMVETARRSVAALLKADPENLVFTSGASEAAATLLSPDWLLAGEAAHLVRLAVLDTDHACVRDGGHFELARVTRLPTNAAGALRIDALQHWADGFEDGEIGLLALTHGNAETGVVQDIPAVRQAIADRPVKFVLDVVQTAGRMPIDLGALGADAVFLSGHKLGAAKGIGAMVLADARSRPMPLLRGGGQEKGRRAGTEAVAAIASFGAAAAAVREAMDDETLRLLSLRRRLETALLAARPDALLLGSEPSALRLPNTVAIALPGLAAETAQMALDLAGFAVSAGSACSSGKVGRSHVIDAMIAGGLDSAASGGAIRISLGPQSTADEVDRFVEAYVALADRIAGPASRLVDGETAHRAERERAARGIDACTARVRG